MYGADNPTRHALVVFINTKRTLTVAGGCGAWRVVVMERVMVSAVDGGEDAGGVDGCWTGVGDGDEVMVQRGGEVVAWRNSLNNDNIKGESVVAWARLMDVSIQLTWQY
nr:hypothetical protein [Tanacetum cinerariifolium]